MLDAFKMRYNEETGKLDYVQFKIKHEFDFSNDPVTNLVDTDNSHTCDKYHFLDDVKEFNEEIERGETDVVKCKDCGRYFILLWSEKEWFEDRDLNIPRRCVSCRKKNKRKLNS